MLLLEPKEMIRVLLVEYLLEGVQLILLGGAIMICCSGAASGGGAINTYRGGAIIICCLGAASGISGITWGAKLSGTLGMRTRIARAMLDLFEDTPLPVSRLRCFIFRSPFCMRVHSLIWLSILASVVFSCVRGPQRFMYSVNLVFRSSRVPNFAISLLRTVTSIFPGSPMTEVF